MSRRPWKPATPRRGGWNPAWGLCPATQKRNYPDRATARRGLRLNGEIHGGSIYRCNKPGCGAYHITHYPPNVQRAIGYLLASLEDDRRKAKRKRKRRE